MEYCWELKFIAQGAPQIMEDILQQRLTQHGRYIFKFQSEIAVDRGADLK